MIVLLMQGAPYSWRLTGVPWSSGSATTTRGEWTTPTLGWRRSWSAIPAATTTTSIPSSTSTWRARSSRPWPAIWCWAVGVPSVRAIVSSWPRTISTVWSTSSSWLTAWSPSRSADSSSEVIIIDSNHFLVDWIPLFTFFFFTIFFIKFWSFLNFWLLNF